MLAARRGRYALSIELALADQGVDCAIGGTCRSRGSKQTEALLDFCREQGLARLMLDQGFGAGGILGARAGHRYAVGRHRAVIRPAPSSRPPRDGEAGARRRRRANGWRRAGAWPTCSPASARSPLPWRRRPVLAAEAARDAHLACKAAAAPRRACRSRPSTATCSAIRCGPRSCAASTAWCSIRREPARASKWRRSPQSGVPRVVYVSCNPSSWARDAAMLKEAGYRLAEAAPGRPVPLVDPCRAGEPIRPLARRGSAPSSHSREASSE